MTFSLEDAKNIGEDIGINWDVVNFTPESFLAGLEVELEHGTEVSDETNITDDDPNMTGQIAWVHLIEDPNYYELLAEMEAEFDREKTPMDRAEGATFRTSSILHRDRVYVAKQMKPVATRTRKREAMQRIAYELSEGISQDLSQLSGEIYEFAKAYIAQAQKSAESLAPREEEPEEFMEYFEDFLDSTPSLHNIESEKLISILWDNPAIGAIPLMQLQAADLIRGEDIDVYDYLQAAVEAAVSVAAQNIVKESLPKKKPHKMTQEEQVTDQEGGTVVEVPSSKKQQKASVMIGSSIYRKVD
jgi:hypothetical protein